MTVDKVLSNVFNQCVTPPSKPVTLLAQNSLLYY